MDFRDSLLKRFISYTKFDTQSDSDEAEAKRPSTPGQMAFLESLRKELEEMGLETYLGEESVLMGRLKGNNENTPAIAFIAHVDVSEDVKGNGVEAVVHDYEGGDIQLGSGLVIKADENPDLAKHVGSKIITSDGSTLLGADDKAGVAEIMEALRYHAKHRLMHGDIEVFFTPDEETGHGVDKFPYSRMRSVCAYTVDGGSEGIVEDECFNAATMKVSVKGTVTHLGDARGKLVNAITVASKIVTLLPESQSPEATDGRYGYYSVLSFSGTPGCAEMKVFIRDFDDGMFEKRMGHVEEIASTVSKLYGADVAVEKEISYRNMASFNKKLPIAVEAAIKAGRRKGFDMRREVIRGGTDGARIAENGIPCPNLYTGGHNYHSLTEWASLDEMNKSVILILSIIQYWAEEFI